MLRYREFTIQKLFFLSFLKNNENKVKKALKSWANNKVW